MTKIVFVDHDGAETVVDGMFRELTGDADEMEEAMLEFNENTQPDSRLSCQIEVSPALERLA